jgi:hypothetical protein
MSFLDLKTFQKLSNLPLFIQRNPISFFVEMGFLIL